MATITHNLPHVVRYGETLGSIATRYQHEAKDIAALNQLQARVRVGQVLMVNKKGRENACGRSCVLITGKHHLRCDCKKKPRGFKEPRNGNGCHGNGQRKSLTTGGAWNVQHTNMAGAGIYEDDQAFCRSVTNACFEGAPRATTPTFQGTPSAALRSATAVTAFAPLHYKGSAAERAKFPQPTCGAGQQDHTVNLFVLYDALCLNAETKVGGVSRTSAREERKRFPLPHFTRAELERSKFPVPTINTRAEIERSKFPVPIFN